MSLSICEWGSQNPWFWAPGVGGIESTIWRTGGDIIPPVVESLNDPAHAKRVITLKNVLDSFEAGMHSEAQHTEYYNDLDMMVIGMRGMTDAMDRIHMGLWAMASAPLMVGSDLTRLSPSTLSLLKNREALAIHNDLYGLQPISVAEPTPGVQVWAKPTAVAGRRAVAKLNRTDSPAQVKIDWGKLGLVGAPRSLRDVWNGRNFTATDSAFSVSAHDLLLVSVDGEDKKPAEYLANQSEIAGIQATPRSAVPRLRYANASGQVAVVHVKSTSGLSTALSLRPTAGSETGTVGFLLPRGTADLSFEARIVALRKLAVYSW